MIVASVMMYTSREGVDESDCLHPYSATMVLPFREL